VVPATGSVTLVAGKRKLSLKMDDLVHYQGERGRRGNKLPRGLQRIDEVIVNGSSDQTRDAEQ
jgi:topoisomerase-4 subunit A